MKRCAAARQTQWFWLEGRAVFGRQLAVSVDGWWCRGIGACRVLMLAGVRVVPVVLVPVVVVLCAVDGARAGGGVMRPLLGRWVRLYGW